MISRPSRAIRLALVAVLVASTAVVGLASEASAAALPGNGLIAFVRANQIFTAKADGTGVKKLTPDKKNYSPKFSPDGKRIAYIHEVSGKRDLWIMNANGTAKTRITTTGDAAGPAWSPDGLWLAYGSNDGFSGGLRKVRTTSPFTVQKIQGTIEDCSNGVQDLTAKGSVAWSPNGRYIAFESYSGCDSPDFYFDYLDLTTGLVINMWVIGGECCGFGYFENPAFSADSKLIAYDWGLGDTPDNVAPQGLDVEVFPGNASAPYTPSANDKQPVFSPNNKYLLFTNTTGGVTAIWRSDLNGANRKKITTGYQPSWQPKP